MVTNTRNSVDRGWAWVVLAGQYLCMLLSSTTYLTGIFNLVFLEEFQQSKFLTAWCVGIYSCMMAFCGPVVSVVISNIGTRPTIYIGATLIVLGYFLSAFVTQFYMLFITYGFIAGGGLGLAYMPGFVLIGLYFEKYRNVAYGIVTTAIGVSILIFAALVNFVVETYGYRGSMIIMAGIMTHMYVVGAVMIPISLETKTEEEQANSKENPVVNIGKDTSVREALLSSLSNLHQTDDKVFNAARNEHKPLKYSFLYSCDVRDQQQNNAQVDVPVSFKDFPASHEGKSSDFQKEGESNLQKHCSELAEVQPAISYQHIQSDTSSMHGSNSLLARISSDMIARSLLSLNHIDSNRESDCSYQCDNADDSSSSHKKHRSFSKFCKYLVLHYKPIFCFEMVIVYLNLILCNFGLACSYVNIPAFAVENGASHFQAAQLISVMGISNLASRLMTGISTGAEGLNTFTVYMGSCGVTGILLCLGPLFGKFYVSELLFSFMVGMYSNCYLTLMSPIAIEFVGTEYLANAYGMQLLMCGIGYVIGPPCAGALYDATGTYQYSLILGGVTYLIGAIVMMLIPMWQHKQRHNEAKLQCHS